VPSIAKIGGTASVADNRRTDRLYGTNEKLGSGSSRTWLATKKKRGLWKWPMKPSIRHGASSSEVQRWLYHMLLWEV
jgi:hypothetical protein